MPSLPQKSVVRELVSIALNEHLGDSHSDVEINEIESAILESIESEITMEDDEEVPEEDPSLNFDE